MTSLNHLNQDILSIRLSTDGFSFSIYNPLKNNSGITTIEKEVDTSISLTANLKLQLQKPEFHASNYKRVNILIVDKRYTLIPLELFEEEQAELLFYHNHSHQENEIILQNSVRKNGMIVVFSMDHSAYQLLNTQYPEVHFYSQVTPMIEYFSIKSKLGNSRKMYISSRRNSIDIYCYEKGHLLLANSFECNHSADRIYYILKIWKQLEFDQQRDELHLWGILPDKDILLQEIKRFILKVFIMNTISNIDIESLLSCE